MIQDKQLKEKEYFEIIYYQNNKFKISWKGTNQFECKKVLRDGSLVEPSNEELLFIMKEIKKKLENRKMQTAAQNYDSLLMSIKTLIDNGTINSYDELKKYIDTLNLSPQEKDKLLKESYIYLENKSIEKSPISIFKGKIINELRKNKQEGVVLAASINIRENITGIDNCEFTLNRYDQNGSLEIEKQTFNYTDEIKKELIEPVLEELVLSAEIKPISRNPVPSGFYRDNMQLTTTDNRIAMLNNIEEGYAEDLEKHLNDLSKESKISDDSERDDKLESLQNEKNNEYTRKRLKTEKNDIEDADNKGFSYTYLIYAIISLITTLLILFNITLMS